MALSSDFQTTRGTVLAIFAQNGTYSNMVDLGGGWLVGAFSADWPGAAGSFVVRSSWNPGGTGHPVQTTDGTILRIASSGSGTFNTLGHAPWNTAALQYVTLQVGTAGTVASGGGTFVLVTGI